MDRVTFDKLSVAISRRGLVRGIAAIIGGGVALAGAGETLAVSPRRTCRQLRKSCTRNDQCCGAYCERSKSAPRRDRFRCACEPGFAICDGACTELGTDDNCGGCGDACTGLDTCFSGACVDACSVLTCDVDETCYLGACRASCADDPCVGDELCLPDLEICIPNLCMADPTLMVYGFCVVRRDGTIADNASGNMGNACSSDADCETYFTDRQTGLQAGSPEMNYGVSCAVEMASWNGEARYVDAGLTNKCFEYIY